MAGKNSKKFCALERTFPNNRLAQLLFGAHNAHLAQIEDALCVIFMVRGNYIKIKGDIDAVNAADHILTALWSQLEKEREITEKDVDAAIRVVVNKKSKALQKNLEQIHDDKVAVKTYKRIIMPRSIKQHDYLSSLKKHIITFGIGPAGTGKTYLAVAEAVAQMRAGKIERLIITRPVVEAGERLGFLPGDLKEKIDPYLRPIYDALYELMPVDLVHKKIESGEIEIAPLAFMRGRTLKRAFIILDEAQNTTSEQMKMFLTRLGSESKMAVNGDITQIDLAKEQESGLADAKKRLQKLKHIGFVHFDKKDVVRHKLVTDIIAAYEN